jgi:hypothetical protein
VSDFAIEIPVRLRDIIGPRVGLVPGLVSMVGEAAKTGGLEASFAGFADGEATTGVLVVGSDIPDAGVEPDPVVSGPGDGEFGSQSGRVGRWPRGEDFGLEVPVETLDKGLVGRVPGRPKWVDGA